MVAHARREFVKMQLGQEVTPETIVPATVIFQGTTDIGHGPDTTIMQPPKQNGSLSVADDGDVLGKSGVVSSNGYATYEDICYPLEAGYKTATPASDGGTPTPARTRVYAPTLTSPDNPKTFSLEVGDNLYAYVLPRAMLANLKLSGKIRDYVYFDSSWLGTDYIEQAFTGALTLRTLERIKAMQAAFYLDDASLGSMGGTPITDCVTEFAWDSGPLYGWTNCLNNQLTPEDHVQQGQQPSLTWTLQLSATTLDLLRKYQAATKLFTRLQLLGNPIHGAGVVVAPAVAATAVAGAAGQLTGDYLYKFVYVNQYGATTGSPALGAAVTLTAQKGAVSAITAGGATVTSRRIYRTVASGSTYLYLATINDNTTTVYVDDLPDSQLGQAIPAANGALTGTLVRKMLQIDMSGHITNWPEVGKAMAEGALSVPVTISGAEDRGGTWGKLIELTVRNAVATLA